MLFVLVVVLVTAPALLGPVLVRRGTALLVRAPQVASIALLGVLVTWVGAVTGLSLALAGAVSGPQMLPAPFADVCQRCLAAASPFTASGAVPLPVPAVVLIALPFVGIAVLGGLGVFRLVLRMWATRALGADVRAAGESVEVCGYIVLVLPSREPEAFTLPRRHGGIVVSRGLMDDLGVDELAAVIEHENAHLLLRHHQIMAVLHAFAHPLRFVPLVRAVQDAVPHLLEIAADDVSRRQCTTSALAGALLKLSAASSSKAPSSPATRMGVSLHAAGQPGSGPDRIRHLVGPVAPAMARAAMAPVLMLTVLSAMLVAIAVLASWPYATLLLAGCALPV